MSVTAVELARRLQRDPKALRATLREWAAAGHPLLRGHARLDPWVFSDEEAEQLARDLRAGSWSQESQPRAATPVRPTTIAEALEDCVSGLAEPFVAAEIIRWFAAERPDVQPSSVRAHIQALTGNVPNRAANHPGLGRREPLLYRVDRGLYRRWRAADVEAPTAEDQASHRLPDRELGAGTPVARSAPTPSAPVAANHARRVLLVGCVKTKQAAPAPARELFQGPLFSRRRSYAEASGAPWFILSAKHALVEPDDVLSPYDVYLPAQSDSYRMAWGRWVVERLLSLTGDFEAVTVEIHAGEAYVTPIRDLLTRHGADVFTPLGGLAMGEQLAWYDRGSPDEAQHEMTSTIPPAAVGDHQLLVAALRDQEAAVTPEEFTRSRRPEWHGPGLYSWWVDAAGAAELSEGLGTRVEPGLIYAGQAGATRWPSGKRSTNTLWGRLNGMHLGGRAKLSTFRLTLASALREPLQLSSADDPRITQWMHAHLRVVVLPVTDGDSLGKVEDAVLDELDPPLNLTGRRPSELRQRLSSLRGDWSR
jgi:hypothetical protein